MSKENNQVKKINGDHVEENEILLSQSLNQFREWIKKHPNIKNCQTDDAFLLTFLRTKKFSIIESCQQLENYLSTRKMLPHLFENLTIKAPELDNLVELRYVLPNVDKKGRLVILTDAKKCDVSKSTAVDCIRSFNLNNEYLTLDERSQLNGVVEVIDFSNVSMAFAALWTPNMIKEMVHCWQKTYPLRIKVIYMINLPFFLNAVLQIGISFFSEKIKSRLRMVSNFKDILEELDLDILPKEYGGKVPASELVKLHKNRLLEVHEKILNNSKMDITVTKASVNFGNSYDADLDTAIVGSFRKIVVD